MKDILGLLTGWKGYLAAAGIAALLAASGAWWITATAKNAVIADLKRIDAEKDRNAYKASLDHFVTTANGINAAALNFTALENMLGKKFAGLSSEFANVVAKNPLPVGCTPGPERLRIIRNATATANNAAAGYKAR